MTQETFPFKDMKNLPSEINEDIDEMKHIVKMTCSFFIPTIRKIYLKNIDIKTIIELNSKGIMENSHLKVSKNNTDRLLTRDIKYEEIKPE